MDHIGLSKAVNWEIAKGYLRAVASASGQHPSNEARPPGWEDVEQAVESFIREFESNGLHE